MITNPSPSTQEYKNLWDAMVISPAHLREVELLASIIRKKQPRYQAVSDATQVPWYFIGVLHMMECACSFSKHLHNGDALIARTVHVPAGRPATGQPPFEWEVSAIDAMQFKGYDKVTDFSVPYMLFLLEKYNGFGYRRYKINTPYLWSYTNHYSRGKYVKDGQFDRMKVSQQCGAAPLLKLLIG